MPDQIFTFAALALYFAGMLLIGWIAFRRTGDHEDYMLGGRNLPPWVAALSAGASDMSGWLVMGLPGAIYVSGLIEAWIAIGLTIGAYLNWLHMSDATLTFPQTLVLRYAHFEPAERKQPQVVEDYSRWFLARLRAVDAALQGQEFLCAGRFTAADLYMASWVGWGMQSGDLPRRGVFAEYAERHLQRPAALRAAQLDGPVHPG